MFKSLTDISPFSYLPENEQANVLKAFSIETLKQGTILMEQEISQVDKFYLFFKGLGQYYFYDLNTKMLKARLEPGDNFGGLSIIFNEGMAIRTLEILEDSELLSLDAVFFSELCEKYPDFKQYFASAFGTCMFHKPFAMIISRRIRDNELNLPFFNRPISSLFSPKISTCVADTPIREAAVKMSKNDISAILIKNKENTVEGIVTDADFKNKVLTGEKELSDPVSSIMSSPLISIDADTQVSDVFLSMTRHDKRHVTVSNQLGRVSGIITQKELIQAQTDASYLLIKTVMSARNIREIGNIHKKLEIMVFDPLNNGANPEYVTRLISACSDAIINRIISFAIEEAGAPPCRFAFLTMGSEGREEQTLMSDQDNAIVFEDTKDPDAAKAYFDKLAVLICDQLNIAGYAFCKGNNMAKNPKWCQPLSKWKEYFNAWIRTSDPETLLYSSIFFDFRGTYGDLALAEELKNYLLDSIQKWPGFLRGLTENALHSTAPISRLGKIQVEAKGKGKGMLDIKDAMVPIVDFARIYALKNGIRQTNTLVRLFRLFTKRVLSGKEYRDIGRAYNYLMRIRFMRQITMIMDEGKEPDNYINLQTLPSIDQTLLKEIFRMVNRFQLKLDVEFKGFI